MSATIVLVACTLLALLGGIGDILTRRIPNLLCFALALVAAAHSWDVGRWDVLSSGLIHGLIALVIGMVLFRIRFIGGGDAKFYAAAALGVPLGQALFMLGWTSLAGAVLLIVWMAVRRFIPGQAEVNLKDRKSVPYGVAIASGFLLTLFGV